MIAHLDTPRGTIVIRPTRDADVEAYRELRQEALRLHPEAFGGSYEESLTYPIERWQKNVRDGAGSDQSVLFVAEANGVLVGMTGIYRHDGAKMRHGANIWGVYVRAEWRGMDIIDALIEACLDWAASKGVRLVKLSVVTSNIPAIRCYARAGFSVFGLEPEVIATDGVYHDELLMVRRVDDKMAG